MRTSSLFLLMLVLAAGGAAYFMSGKNSNSRGLDAEARSEPTLGQTPGALSELPVAAQSQPRANERELISGPVSVVQPAIEPPESAVVPGNALNGRVVDLAGIGIEGCDIYFLEDGIEMQGVHSGPEIDLEMVPHAETDASGRFRLENLPAGHEHALRVQHADIALVFVEGVLLGDFGEFEEPPIVLTYGKRLRGTVTDEDGLPISGVELRLDGAWLPANPRASFDSMSALSDAQGKYEMIGIPDGKRCLTAVAPGLGRITRIQSLIFTDKTGQAHVCDLQLRRTGNLAGRVTHSSGAGIGGVELLAVDRAAYRDVGNSRTTSEPDGSFRFENLSEGKYQVSAKAPGFDPVIVKEVAMPTEQLAIVLRQLAMIRGAVVDASNGAGLANFSLQLCLHQTGAAGLAVPTGPIRIEQGASGGIFALPAAGPAGLWRVRAEAAGFAPSDSEPFEFNGADDVNEIVVAMQHGGSIRGRLVNGAGEPIPGGRVTSRSNNWRDDALSRALGGEEGDIATLRNAHSGKNGGFVLANLRPSKYQLILRGSQLHEVNLRDLVVKEGAELDLGDVLLQPGGSLSGRLLDSESAPVSGGRIFLNPTSRSGTEPLYRAKSGQDGRWRIRVIVPGEYALSGKPPETVAGNMFGNWPSPGGELVPIVGGTEDYRDIHLDDWTLPQPPVPQPPTGQLSGKVLGASGDGLIGVALRLVSVDASPGAREGKSGRSGAFSFVGLLPGSYVLSIADQPESSVEVSIVADRWANADLRSSQ